MVNLIYQYPQYLFITVQPLKSKRLKTTGLHDNSCSADDTTNQNTSYSLIFFSSETLTNNWIPASLRWTWESISQRNIQFVNEMDQLIEMIWLKVWFVHESSIATSLMKEWVPEWISRLSLNVLNFVFFCLNYSLKKIFLSSNRKHSSFI